MLFMKSMSEYSVSSNWFKAEVSNITASHMAIAQTCFLQIHHLSDLWSHLSEQIMATRGKVKMWMCTNHWAKYFDVSSFC